MPLYWGDVNIEEEDRLLSALEGSSTWKQLWFQEFRSKQLLQFAGDAALYISRAVGAKVVDRLLEQAKAGLSNFKEQDRLHLVTHSWGTVILFDVLFAARWDPENTPGYKSVQEIRKILYGLEPDAGSGLRLTSIHTMGSPIAIFSLLDIDEITEVKPSHDITPQLQQFLENIHRVLGSALPWNNFIHPGDPVAYPLEVLLPQLVDGESKFLDVQDIVTHNANLGDYITNAFSQSILALLHGGDAHSSYWQSEEVAKKIAEQIARVARRNGQG